MERDVIVTIGQDKYKTEITMGDHLIIADEPKDVGGQDLGPNPKEILLSSLGTCKAMTVRMYADRKEWPLTRVTVKLSLSTQKAEKQNTTFIHSHISFDGDLDEEQKKRLFAISDRCPIHKILSEPIVIESNLV